MDSRIQDALDRMTNIEKALDEWKSKLKELSQTLREDGFNQKLSETLNLGPGAVSVVAGVRQEIIKDPSNEEQKAAIESAPGSVVIRTHLALDLGASSPVVLTEGTAVLTGQVYLTIDVPALFIALTDELLDGSLENTLQAVKDQVGNVKQRLHHAVLAFATLDRDTIADLSRGTRIEMGLSLDGSLSLSGTPVVAKAAGGARLKASYQALQGGRWQIDIDKNASGSLDASGKISVQELDVGFQAKVAGMRRHSRTYELDAAQHSDAFMASLPWTPGSGGKIIPKIDATALEDLGVRTATSFEALLEADYGAEIAGSVHPAVKLGARATRNEMRRVAVTYAGSPTQGSGEKLALDLASLDIEAAAIAPRGCKVLHLTRGKLDVLGEVEAGKSIDIGELLRLRASGKLGVSGSRDTLVSLHWDWPENGRPIARLEETKTAELAASISASVGLEFQDDDARGEFSKKIEERLRSVEAIEDILEAVGAGDVLGDGTDELAAKAEKFIGERLNLSVQAGWTHGESTRHTFCCGPFDLSQPNHRDAFNALRSDHNIGPALDAGLIGIQHLRTEQRDGVTAELNMLQDLSITYESFDKLVNQQVEFNTGQLKGEINAIEVSGGERSGFRFFDKHESAKYEWKSASVVATSSATGTALERILLAAKAQTEDGQVDYPEARRWKILLQNVASNVSLRHFKEQLTDDSRASGNGIFSFQLNRAGLFRLFDPEATPLEVACQTFLSFAAQIEGAPGSPPCGSIETVPMTYRALKLVNADDKRVAAARFRAEFGAEWTLEDVREAALMLSEYASLGSDAEREVLEREYEDRFGGDIEGDLVRWDSADQLRLARKRYIKARRRSALEGAKRHVRNYMDRTGRNREQYTGGLQPANRRAFIGAELRMLEQEEVFTDALYDLQSAWQRRGPGAETDSEFQRQQFVRLSEFAHKITPDPISGIRDRVQAYVLVHAMTLITLAGVEGYTISEFSYDSERLRFEAVERPIELDLAKMIVEVGTDLGVDLGG